MLRDYLLKHFEVKYDVECPIKRVHEIKYDYFKACDELEAAEYAYRKLGHYIQIHRILECNDEYYDSQFDDKCNPL